MDDQLTQHAVPEEAASRQKPKQAPQYVASLCATLGVFTLGGAMSWTSPASEPLLSGSYIPGVKVTTSQEAWIGALMPLGAAFMSFPISYLMDAIGRKAAMLWMTLPLLLGWALIIWANGVEMLYAGRFLVGTAGGAFGVVVPVYTAEVGEASVRGTLGGYFELMAVLGTLLVYAMGVGVSLFVLSIVCGIVPLVFAALFVFMPETPLFYMTKGREAEARRSLHFLRGKDYDIEEELEELRERCRGEKGEKGEGLLGELKKVAVRRALSISMGLMVFQQFCGVNAVTFNTSSIFREAKSKLDPDQASVVIGAVQCLGAFVSTVFVDRWGRRVLLTVSAVVMCLCTTLLGFYFHYDLQEVSWLPIVCLAVYMCVFELGFGPIPWIIVGELFLPKVQSRASSISVFLNTLLISIVVKFYPDLVAWVGAGATFWIFSVCLVFALIFIWVFVVETKGKTAQQIQQDLAS